MAYFHSFWLRLLLISLLCVSANAITINNNLTVILEDLTDVEDRSISVPEVERLILQCGQTVDQQVQVEWSWSSGSIAQACFMVNKSLTLNCVNASFNGRYTCSYGSINRSVAVEFTELETLFVSEDLRYIGPNVHISLPLGPRDRRGGELVIPCVPVGQPPAGTYRADWLFNRNRANLLTDGKPVVTGPHPEDGGASVRLENVTGTNGSVTNGALRIGSLFPTVAGYYQCILYEGGVKVANNTALLYYGPAFDRFSFRNASAIEGQVAELLCEAFAFPVPEFEWERCENQDSCFPCNNPKRIDFNLSKYDWWQPRPANLALYGLQNVLQVRDVVFESPGSDRGCYLCRIRHEGGSAERRIFLRVRDNLAVLWPIMGIVCEAILVALFILGGSIYSKWKQSQQPPPPTRSISGTSEDRNLLPPQGSEKSDTPVNADGSRKRSSSPAVASSSV